MSKSSDTPKSKKRKIYTYPFGTEKRYKALNIPMSRSDWEKMVWLTQTLNTGKATLVKDLLRADFNRRQAIIKDMQ